ncbi:hypothetical protein M5689_013423 [Euphorbia peplus]|nr:hypothetical protein M5689_013423 [Euphorbia peplus]
MIHDATSSSQPQQQLDNDNGTFWTLCPYCYYLYEYHFIYIGSSLTCQNCRKFFHGVAVPPPPPGMLVEGKDQYYVGVACFSLKYGLGTSLDAKEADHVGVRASSLDQKKGTNDANSENFVVISDDDSDFGDKDECENEKGQNFVDKDEKVEDFVDKNEKAGGFVVKKEEETGPVLQRRRNVKAVVRSTKKLMGRGIRYNTGFGFGGKADAELKEEVGESQPENTGGIRSEEEEGFPEDNLEFFVGDDDIYVGLKPII